MVNSNRVTPLVFLHGWGSDSRVWRAGSIAEYFPYAQLIDLPGFADTDAHSNSRDRITVDQACESVVAQLPQRCHLVGWSLGGLFATRIATQYPERLSSLITVATNLRFIASSDWPGMDYEQFRTFQKNFADQPDRVIKQFIRLQASGDDASGMVVQALSNSGNYQTNHLDAHRQGLEWLQTIDNRNAFVGLSVPGLHIFGTNDRIVPISVIQKMNRLKPPSEQRYLSLEGVAHAPFISSPEVFADAISGFIEKLPYQIKKSSIAESFSRSAQRYDEHAGMQHTIGRNLLDWSRVNFSDVQEVLDVGCGTGQLCNDIAVASSNDSADVPRVHGIDLAYGMLREARSINTLSKPFLVNGDAENLPYNNSSIDVIVSCNAMQWCPDISSAFVECKRVLKDNGKFLLALFVEGTLHELEASWKAVDANTHVNQFYTVSDISQQLKGAGFDEVDVKVSEVVQEFSSVVDLMRSLKVIGAHNMNAGQNKGLLGKAALQRLIEEYNTFLLPNGRYPATYKVLYVNAQ